VVFVFRQMSNCWTAILWWEQVTFTIRWWWGPLCTRPTHL